MWPELLFAAIPAIMTSRRTEGDDSMNILLKRGNGFIFNMFNYHYHILVSCNNSSHITVSYENKEFSYTTTEEYFRILLEYNARLNLYELSAADRYKNNRTLITYMHPNLLTDDQPNYIQVCEYVLEVYNDLPIKTLITIHPISYSTIPA